MDTRLENTIKVLLGESDSTTEAQECRERVFARLPLQSDGLPVLESINRGRLTGLFQAVDGLESLVSIGDYSKFLAETIVQYSVNLASPRCLGHMTGPVLGFSRTLAELLVALNQNLVKEEASRALTLLERQTIGIMHNLVFSFPDSFYRRHAQRPESTLGIMTSGSTIANITALWIGRNRAFPPLGDFPGIERQGLGASLKHAGYVDAVFVGSNLMHYSIEKAATLSGLGSENVLKVPVDTQNRMSLGALREVLMRCQQKNRKVLAIVGTAGTTDCGTIDPLFELAALAREYGAHFHVDAAWGGALLFSDQHKDKLRGLELADTVTIDGHKQLHLPLGSSMLLLRDPQAAGSIEKAANYMLHGESADLGKRSLEGSRSGNALYLHAALKLIGPTGYGTLIERKMRSAAAMAARIRSMPEFELLAEPETNIVLYRFIPRFCRESFEQKVANHRTINLLNERLQKAQFEEGRSLVSRTKLGETLQGYPQSITALRAIITNPRTSLADIAAVLEDQTRIGERLTPQTTGRASLEPCTEVNHHESGSGYRSF